MYENDSERDQAIRFLQSMRGHFIVSQALSIAIKQMEAVQPEIMQEKSNIADMRFLYRNLFPLFIDNLTPNKEE